MKKIIEGLASTVEPIKSHTTKVDSHLIFLEEMFNSFGKAVQDKFQEDTSRLDRVEKQCLESIEDAKERVATFIKKETQERHPDIAKFFEEIRADFQLEEDKELKKFKLLKLKHEWGKVYDYLAEFNRLTSTTGCTEEQRKGILNDHVGPSVIYEIRI